MSATDCPLQIDGEVGDTLIVGNGFIVTVRVLVLVQPLASVPTTVYVVVEEGFADTVEPVVEDNPVEGLHI